MRATDSKDMDLERRSAERPAKRARLLSDESSSEQSEAEEELALHGVAGEGLKINKEFAKRFEHNKKREELHKLEEKYGGSDRNKASYKNGSNGAADSETDSDSEDEDDEGELVTQDLDAEIFDALNAIRSKDPRVYDKSVNFYRSLPDDGTVIKDEDKKAPKPVHLRDYHRQNLLGEKVDGTVTAQTYPEEQAFVKRDLMKQMRKAEEENDTGSDQEDFFTAKRGHKSRPVVQNAILETDIEAADKDPEGYLSKFMASRAWVPTPDSRFQPFESDDDDDLDRADEFEEAYNMRFEDPKKANEKLISHSREAASKYSVRRDEVKGRKRARQQEREAKEAVKLERDDEKARLRKLKIEEAQEKLERFKKAAGLKKEALPVEKWADFLEDGWDSDNWENEMEQRFGDEYYQDHDKMSDTEDGDDKDETKKRRSVKKPEWDDDIDIGDIIPDFEAQEEQAAKAFTLSDDDIDDGDPGDMNRATDAANTSKNKKLDKKEAEKMRSERKRQARKERQRIEELVDQSMANETLPQASSKRDGQFRYRETSPTAFGLSARDILMADDSHLNEFAGLKKLASYRDSERKKKDKKKLGKKARLRQWRKDTFGNAEGPTIPFEEYFGSGQGESPRRPKSNIIDRGPSKKRRRSIKRRIAQGTF